MVMRVGGLASGMDIEQMVNQLMSAERIPLQKMEQDRTLLEWKRDGFREVYQKLFDFDEMMLGMKLSETYNSKQVSSSNEDAVTAVADPGTSNGSYNIEVTQLASSAINSSQSGIIDPEYATEFDPNKSLEDQKHMFKNGVDFGSFEFVTFDENGKEVTHSFDVKAEDSLNDVLKRITNDDNNVRAFFDNTSQKVIMETTRTGNYNNTDKYLGAEIGFNGQTNSAFLTNTLQIKNGEQVDGAWKRLEKGGQDAKFTYNGAMELESKNNSYKLNGVTFNFKSEGTANLTVNNDVDTSFDSIMKFVDQYNEIVEMINGSQQEEKYRDYKPLTQEQKDDMSDKEIELWEERAKSGILRGESSLSSGLFSMRQSWYSKVDTGGEFTSLTQVGIKTSSNYMDGGKLIVNEKELKDALRDDPAAVQKLFSNSAEGDSRGLVNRLEDAVETTMRQLEDKAGRPTSTLDNYTLGKRMKDLNTRISDFEQRMVRVENRYWSQFTAMEKAISQMNNQSAQLMSQFGGM
ncbi:flagellar hook-associated protein 2 [Ornithinibacillus salinisoli]|uniref:Flagellar hook-associated protein 2 n=1 Tax=Ornithinibacillus salinisoli TaxID=1848459 RepID=A0ABW4W1U4_9BACI